MHQKIVEKLNVCKERITHTHLRALFKEDPKRFEKMSMSAAGLFLDYSKNRVDQETLETLFELVDSANVLKKRSDMFAGEKINFTEHRAVLHTALRNFSGNSVYVEGQDVMPEIEGERDKMTRLVEMIHSGEWKGFSGKRITDVVNIGIGGSDLGPRMVVRALEPYHTGHVAVHFVSNVDGYAISQTLKQLNPETTLFIVASKTFTTQETLMNAETARTWLVKGAENEQAVAQHFLAISTNMEATSAFGIASENCFTMWDWVGGRYSLWSAIGLPIMLAIGSKGFESLLKGAYEMDQHFLTADVQKNMPTILAILSIWNSNFFGHESQAILGYDERLSLLVDYLQQADMESNGKSCLANGKKTAHHTGVTLWGGVGTNGQHAFHQLLHQGSITISCDFIIARKSAHTLQNHHQALAANCFAQSQALMSGKTEQEALEELLYSGLTKDDASKLAPHKVIEGNKPSNTIMCESLTPESLGALIALYEHKIFVQGVIWDINSFDQWGVELGKQLGKPIFETIQAGKLDEAHFDCSTAGLLTKFMK